MHVVMEQYVAASSARTASALADELRALGVHVRMTSPRFRSGVLEYTGLYAFIPCGARLPVDLITRALADGRIEKTDARDDARQCYGVYSLEEVTLCSAFYFNHTGRCLSTPKPRGCKTHAISDIVDVDITATCPACGQGCEFTSPVRLPGAELNKAGRFASTDICGTDFFFVSESFLEELALYVPDEMPLTPIEVIGRVRTKERWWQIWPHHMLPASLFDVRSAPGAPACETCGALIVPPLDGPGTCPSFVLDPKNRGLPPLPPFFWSPMWLEAYENRQEGRVSSGSIRHLLARGDVGRALAAMNVSRLSFVPVPRAAEITGEPGTICDYIDGCEMWRQFKSHRRKAASTRSKKQGPRPKQ